MNDRSVGQSGRSIGRRDCQSDARMVGQAHSQVPRHPGTQAPGHRGRDRQLALTDSVAGLQHVWQQQQRRFSAFTDRSVGPSTLSVRCARSAPTKSCRCTHAATSAPVRHDVGTPTTAAKEKRIRKRNVQIYSQESTGRKSRAAGARSWPIVAGSSWPSSPTARGVGAGVPFCFSSAKQNHRVGKTALHRITAGDTFHLPQFASDKTRDDSHSSRMATSEECGSICAAAVSAEATDSSRRRHRRWRWCGRSIVSGRHDMICAAEQHQHDFFARRPTYSRLLSFELRWFE